MMAMGNGLRDLTKPVHAGQWPSLSCPYCTGSLVVVKVEEIQSQSSISSRDDDDWDPEWIFGRFVASAKCYLCGEPVIITGSYKTDADLTTDGKWFGEYASFYHVEATSPGLRLATTPPGTPAEVDEAFKEAASVLWSSPASAANTLRRGVEALLNAKRVKKTTLVKGKRSRLKTHARIELLKKTNLEVANALMAVKWIGNEGSHAQTLTVEDVLDGVEMLEWAVKSAFDTEDLKLKRRIALVNKAKGPRGLRR
jgi:hypothetical protein